MAPSPTGPLHLGTVRTGLFNWLFARHCGGVFVLRIEDTDTARSERKYEEELIAGYSWLGIDWDEGPDKGGPYGPYRQSERIELYKKYLEKLLAEKKAYYCYCSKEELELEREAMQKKGEAPRYSGKCRDLASPPAGAKPQVIRFKTPPEIVEFNDLIRGAIKFDMALLGDIAIAKSVTEPLYNFAVVIDDYEMKISHVIRGEDHIANTPKQILLQRAFGFPIPEFAHLPLLLNPDKSKLSKRHTETSFMSYRAAGYLPEALMNFIALLGWHPSGGNSRQDASEQEIFTAGELIEKFELARVQKAGAVFSEEKLSWVNSMHLRQLTVEALYNSLKPLAEARGLTAGPELFKKALEISKERLKTLEDFFGEADIFFNRPAANPAMLPWKSLPAAETKKNLEAALDIIANLDASELTLAGAEAALMPLAEERGRGETLWPLRVALSGRKASPGPFEIIYVIGKEETLSRVRAAIAVL